MEQVINPNEFAAAHGIVFIDLRIDMAFKTVFGMPGCEEDLLYLLQNILPEKEIVSLSLRQTEQVPDLPDAKKVIYDIFCESADGSKFVVEMQMAKQNDFAERMVFYSTFPIRNCVMRGGDSYGLKDVYVVSLLDFLLPGIKKNDRIINHYTIRNDDDSSIQLTRSVNYVTVELPKVRTDSESMRSSLNRLLYLIRYSGGLAELPSEIMADKRLERICEKSIFANMNIESQREYIARIMSEIDEKSRVNTAHDDGVAEGIQQGIEQGIQQGIEQGTASANIATAMRMLEKGFSDSDISECTGLPLEDIRNMSQKD